MSEESKLPEQKKDGNPEQDGPDYMSEIGVQETGQPGQIFSMTGIPFKSEAAARAAITKKSWNPDDYQVRSFEDGFVLVPKPKVITVEEKFYRVIFNHKSGPNDEEDVTLVVNGEPLLIKRGAEVIIPERYKECADHATYPQFTQRPNESRKQIGEIMVFPYSTRGEATKQEYLAQLADGNRRTQIAMSEATKLV